MDTGTNTQTGTIHAQCFPLYSIMLGLDQIKIDFMSLDARGDELDILGAIPFDKLEINLISVKYRVYTNNNTKIDEHGSGKKLDRVRNFFEKIGNYQEIGILPWETNIMNLEKRENSGSDVFFVRRSVE